MATRQILICDRCGTKRAVNRHTLELHGTEFGGAAWVMDLDAKCFREFIREVSETTGSSHTSIRDARSQKAIATGNAPYEEAAGVSLREVRDWAMAHKIPVSGRGRINSQVIRLFKTCSEQGDGYLKTTEARTIVRGLSA